jgi:molybdopterin/thiamine biosynthesis adenylyltransferase
MTEPQYDLVIEELHFYQLREHLLNNSPVEGAAYLLCGRSSHRRRVKLLVRQILFLRSSDFDIQSNHRLQISPVAAAKVMKDARLSNQSIVLVHSHPLSDDHVDFSWVDDEGERESFANFYERVQNGPHGSLVFGQRAIRGRIWHPNSATSPMTNIWVVGASLRSFSAAGCLSATHGDQHVVHARQVQAFGSSGQTQIERASIAIVGVGGTGSAVVDQLLRLGVRRLLVVDDDIIEESNVSRIYNSTLADVISRQTKVSVVERHATALGLDANVTTVVGNIADTTVALELRQADIVFCCTDNQWSRAILNQYAYQYLTPVIDMGNKIDSKNGEVTTANGRVYVIAPNRPCLWCCGILDGKRVAEESLPHEQRQSLAREGYVTDLETSAPSVIFLNTVIAGLAISEFVNLVTAYMGRSYYPQLTYYPLTGEVKSAIYESDPSCFCAIRKYTALGDSVSLPCV